MSIFRFIARSLKVDRPLARAPVAGWTQFTLANNTGASVPVVERTEMRVSAYGLTRGNTAASYQHRMWTTTGGVREDDRRPGRSGVRGVRRRGRERVDPQGGVKEMAVRPEAGDAACARKAWERGK